MTRFARAKGSKSSNERLPLESTPWQVMKQHLEVALENEKNQDPKTKTKSAKQLLNEKEDLYYATSLGNVVGDWAEFETSKAKVNTVKNSKVEKKHKNEKKKLKEVCKKSIEEENFKNETNITTEKIEKHIKNKKETKEEKQTKKDKNVSNTESTVETETVKLKKKKDKNQNYNILENIDTKQQKEKKTFETEVNESTKKKLKRKNDDETVETDSNQFKEKKRKNTEKKNKKTTEKANDTRETIVDDSSKSESTLQSGSKMSKRQKRNQKKQIQKQESIKDSANNATFNAEGNDWNNSVNFNNRKFDDNEAPNKFREKRRFNSLEEKNLFRFGNNIPRKFQPKTGKVRDDEEHKRRKPELNSTKMTINGMDVEIVKYDGFPIRKEDAERLTELKKEMAMKGIPKVEVDAAMKLERRKCEKALARIRKQVCFHCRRAGHNLSDCPELGKEEAGTGICFKCGSTEHTHFECKVNKSDDYRYAKCFICREQGHVAKQCPDNPKGMYPDGGCCKICGDVTHLKKDCPDLVKEKEETTITLDTIKDTNLESIGGEMNRAKKEAKPSKKVVKF